MIIKEMMVAVHQNAKEHGWWDEPRTFGEIIALIHSEASEALEEHRNGHQPNETYYSGKDKDLGIERTSKTKIDIFTGILVTGITDENPISRDHDSQVYFTIQCDKPEGIPSELADIVIRVIDYCEHEGIDLEKAILEKHEYNQTRPYKHGGKKI